MKPVFFFCIHKNKDTDQLHSKCADDLHLCFCYIFDSMIHLLSKSLNIGCCCTACLCRTLSETLKTVVFLQ